MQEGLSSIAKANKVSTNDIWDEPGKLKNLKTKNDALTITAKVFDIAGVTCQDPKNTVLEALVLVFFDGLDGCLDNTIDLICVDKYLKEIKNDYFHNRQAYDNHWGDFIQQVDTYALTLKSEPNTTTNSLKNIRSDIQGMREFLSLR